jgi:plasmid stabilization system protein ParE
LKLVWTIAARHDLEQAVDYVMHGNPEAAMRLLLRIQKSTDLLADFPALGTATTAGVSRVWTVPRTPYRVLYRIDEDHVLILRVVHGATDWRPEDE